MPLISDDNKKEIFYHIVNSGLAGLLVLLGGIMSTGTITKASLVSSLVAGLIIAANKFKEYWKTEEKEYTTNKLFVF